MWRNETKADVKEKEALARKKYAEKLNSNPYLNLRGYQQTYHATKVDNTPYVDIGKQSEEARIREQRHKEKEKQDFINKIASVQDHEQAFTPAELYDAGIEARKKGDGIEATMRLWQALICGDKRAAFPLFEMLRDGEAGISKNMEMAGMFLFVGRRVEDEKCIGIPNLKDMPFDAAKAIFSICAKSRGYIVNQNKKLADEILFEIQDKADEVLDDFSLKTRAKHQPMLDVFVHPVLVVDDQTNEVPLAGEDEVDPGCCCIF